MSLLITLLTLFIVIPFIVLVPHASAYGQASTKSAGSFDFNDSGIHFSDVDSSNHVIMRFRIQSLATTTVASADPTTITSTEWAVRRLRLRFGGTLGDKRLTFNVQFSFTRGDMDWTDTRFPNLVRDAMVFWNFSPDLQIGFGQTKLPGNRQRVISSGDLQFSERSIVNNAFNLDRDFGFQSFWRARIDDAIFNFRGALSTGDGRNQPRISGAGFAYTGRVEVLPMGEFLRGGDYFEGDVMHEPKPKISLGASYSHNSNHTRSRGQLGPLLAAPRTSNSFLADALVKFRGLALYTEYAMRTADNPITGLDSAVFVGTGYLIQTSYHTPYNIELALRFARVTADDALIGMKDGTEQTTSSANVIYYLNRHRVKAMMEFMYVATEFLNNSLPRYDWVNRFNLEVGI